MFKWYIATLWIVNVNDKIEHLADELLRRWELGLQDTTLVMDSHADFNFLVSKMSITLSCSGNL
jgi:hypothetical protein